ncbi:hypothetical protein [Kushneria phosphatilytica]|uniref:Uncharacterized protein n=1 Tax=Kushneria phosphatilytica TaxID=657387 RepID=A0A1S1NVA1_9GAMM|nr:hypothetical protein [Kushneria phosphatilytica]OHV08806.1 hypothetical protein BH688_12380 [Kushneria phosphatilytica]QEL12526.1 hypothetical protein FY550_16180 [Kushneria phosphatilytica]
MNERQMALEALRYDLRERLQLYRTHQPHEGETAPPGDNVMDQRATHVAQELARVEQALLRIAAGEGDYCGRCLMRLEGWQLTTDPCATLCAYCEARPNDDV